MSRARVGRPKRLMAREVAELAGLTIRAIHKARSRGQLIGQRLGKAHWYYEPEAVEQWLRGRG